MVIFCPNEIEQDKMRSNKSKWYWTKSNEIEQEQIISTVHELEWMMFRLHK